MQISAWTSLIAGYEAELMSDVAPLVRFSSLGLIVTIAFVTQTPTAQSRRKSMQPSCRVYVKSPPTSRYDLSV